MAIQDDFTIDQGAKTVTHTAGTTVYSVNALYSWIMDRVDDLDFADDTVPMKFNTPDQYEWINGWKMGDEASYQFLTGGAIDDKVNLDTYVQVKTIGTIEAGSQVYIVQGGSKIASWWPTGHVDVLIKTRAAGSLIAGGLMTVFIREYGDKYSHFKLDASNSLVNTVALATEVDKDNATAEATVATWTDVAITHGSFSRDLDNGNGAKSYDVEIDGGGRPLAEVYERLKWATRHGSTEQVGSPLVDGEQYTAAQGSYIEVTASPYGTFAGGKFFGARGVWITNYDPADNQAFNLIAADGTTQIPPNLVNAQVTALGVGDRVAIFRLTAPAGVIDKSRYTAAAGNNLGNATFVVNEAIASDEPKVGWVRIGDDSYSYTDWSGSTFTLSGTLSQSYALNDPAYVPILDDVADASTETNTLKYAADIPVLIRVRQKGILPFEVESTINNKGVSVAAIRVADTVVT